MEIALSPLKLPIHMISTIQSAWSITMLFSAVLSPPLALHPQAHKARILKSSSRRAWDPLPSDSSLDPLMMPLDQDRSGDHWQGMVNMRVFFRLPNLES